MNRRLTRTVIRDGRGGTYPRSKASGISAASRRVRLARLPTCGSGWVRASVLMGEGRHAGLMDGASAADDRRRGDVSVHLEADIAGEGDLALAIAVADTHRATTD